MFYMQNKLIESIQQDRHREARTERLNAPNLDRFLRISLRLLRANDQRNSPMSILRDYARDQSTATRPAQPGTNPQKTATPMCAVEGGMVAGCRFLAVACGCVSPVRYGRGVPVQRSRICWDQRRLTEPSTGMLLFMSESRVARALVSTA